VTINKNPVPGVWRLRSALVDGKPAFGAKPDGLLVLTPDGQFAQAIISDTLPPYASGDRLDATAEEYSAVVRATIGLYGVYELNDDGTSTDHVIGATFPNWANTLRHSDKLRRVVDGDVLSEFSVLGGETIETVWHRAGDTAPFNHPTSVVGTWRLEAAKATVGDDVVLPFGNVPAGRLIFTSSGYFIDVLHRSDIPAFASASRSTGTTQENTAAVQGSLIVFGQYSGDHQGDFRDERVLGASITNWTGMQRNTTSLTETVSGDMLTEHLNDGDGVDIHLTFRTTATRARHRKSTLDSV
jgi:hypothetical protein